jgi:hypothetical protein
MQFSNAIKMRLAVMYAVVLVLIAGLALAMPDPALAASTPVLVIGALQLSTSVRNARLDQIESTIGTSALMRIRTGAPPADCGTADSGSVLATLTLPSDWMAAASGGSKAKSGTWQDSSADATGTAGHFRIYDSGGTVCHIQGTVTATGGGGDLTVDNTSFASGQNFTVTSFTLTDGNA